MLMISVAVLCRPIQLSHVELEGMMGRLGLGRPPRILYLELVGPIRPVDVLLIHFPHLADTFEDLSCPRWVRHWQPSAPADVTDKDCLRALTNPICTDALPLDWAIAGLILVVERRRMAVSNTR